MTGDGSDLEFARWQGSVDARLQEHDRRFLAVGTDIADIKGLLSSVREDVAGLRGRVSVWAAVGSILGGGVVSAIVKWL